MAASHGAQERIYAWLIDLLIFVGVGIFFGPLGWLASTGYWLFRDGLFEGQSIGKRLLGLQVVARQGSARATFLTSAIRNLLWIIPLVNLVMGVTGLYLLFHDGGGRHWGDRLADTRVVKV